MQKAAAQTQAPTPAEVEVRALLDEWVAGCRAGDLERICACYDPAVVSYDAILQVQFKGLADYRAHWETCISHMQDGMVYEPRELSLVAEGGIAFCHYLARCGATDSEGNERTGWLRVTQCCTRGAGGWRIVHEHFSAPFDPETMKILDVQP